MRIRLCASYLVVASSVTMVGCAAGSTEGSGSNGTNLMGQEGSSGSSGSSPSGSGGGGSSGGSGGGGNSSTGSSGGGAGDDSSTGDNPSTGDDGGTSSGGSSSGGSSGSSGSCTGFIRGAAPTSAAAAMAGPYQTMKYAADASVRSTKAYDVTSAHITYPVGATAPFAAIAIVPGFTAMESSIADWAPFLASWGIVTMTFGTSNPSTGASDTGVAPQVRADALIDALTTIKGENTRSGSPLDGKLDVTRLGVAGWSMGGGGTLLAANKHPELKAVFAMEPWNPSTTYPTDTVPTLIFAGTADGLAGPPMPTDQYSSIPATTPKMIYEVTNGTHYVSTSPTNSGTDMAPDTQSTPNVARFGLSWLKVYLECDTRFRQFLLVKPSDETDFETTLM